MFIKPWISELVKRWLCETIFYFRPSSGLPNYLRCMEKLQKAVKYFTSNNPGSPEMSQVVSVQHYNHPYQNTYCWHTRPHPSNFCHVNEPVLLPSRLYSHLLDSCFFLHTIPTGDVPSYQLPHFISLSSQLNCYCYFPHLPYFSVIWRNSIDRRSCWNPDSCQSGQFAVNDCILNISINIQVLGAFSWLFLFKNVFIIWYICFADYYLWSGKGFFRKRI